MRINKMALCALFAALTAVLSQIIIPIGPVPINLAHVAIFAGAGLLGPKYGAISQCIYIGMGAIGLPVFAGFMGGVGRLAGPTGGFLVTYIPIAFLSGFLMDKLGRQSTPRLFVAMYAGWIVTYAGGTLWYAYMAQVGIVAALLTCVVPFLIGDACKTVLVAALVKRLSPVLYTRPAYAAAASGGEAGQVDGDKEATTVTGKKEIRFEKADTGNSQRKGVPITGYRYRCG